MTASNRLPKSAFLGVTLLCNSRCIMCDIWKNKGKDFLPLDLYKKLPPSLEMIDITGGEPFLRPDIPELVAVLKKACPRARILITTHGFMTSKIAEQMPALLKADPRLAFRISVDGLEKTHEEIRGIPQAFEKVEETLEMLQKAGVKDLGIIFTLMRQNSQELRQVYDYAKRHKISFTLNAVHDSPIYFGEGKIGLNADPLQIKRDFDYVFWQELKKAKPKNLGKAWFVGQLYRYLSSHHRPFACGSGEDFFYMDSHANLYMCQYKNWPIGNLTSASFNEIWNSQRKENLLDAAHHCHDCWAVCTVKDAIQKNKFRVLGGLMGMIRDALRF